MERLKRKTDDRLMHREQTPEHMPLIVKGARRAGGV